MFVNLFQMLVASCLKGSGKILPGGPQFKTNLISDTWTPIPKATVATTHLKSDCSSLNLLSIRSWVFVSVLPWNMSTTLLDTVLGWELHAEFPSSLISHPYIRTTELCDIPMENIRMLWITNITTHGSISLVLIDV